MKEIDVKGVVWFLAITFSLTIGLSLILWSRSLTVKDPAVGFALLGMMFLPAVSAFIVRKFITREGFSGAGLKWGNRRPYLLTWAVIPVYFLVIYTLTAIFVSAPDLTLTRFMEQYGLSDTDLPISPAMMLVAVLMASLFLSPIVNFIPSFGEEFGWRGYLLPKLLPLGEVKALLLSGFIWSLWHLPFIILLGFGFGDNSLAGIVLYIIMVTLLGIIIGYFWIVYGSTYLAAFMHGVFNAQAKSIWVMIFPGADPLIGGTGGVIAIAIILIPSIAILKKFSRKTLLNRV
jgi:membrane protease YdiL (CAAX protease family)